MGIEESIWFGLEIIIVGTVLLNREIKLIGGQAAGALGAAIMAGAGAGLFKDERAGSQALAIQPRIVSPDKDEVQVYEEYYMRKNHEIEALHSLYAAAAARGLRQPPKWIRTTAFSYLAGAGEYAARSDLRSLCAG